MQRFISITKPGIIFGNLITAIGGFFLASHHTVNVDLLLATLLGLSLVIASGCVLNNIIDRDIDSLMQRTCNRVIVKGLVSPTIAILYGIVLSFLGFFILYRATNLITVDVAFLGLFVYVLIYTLVFKRASTLGTLIGAISGAVPPVVGYCALTNRFDAGAIILFLILFFWQMPHFYAISIVRLKDYSAARIPILPVVKSLRYTKIAMLLYTILFAISAILPTLFGLTGVVYFVVALLIGLIWLGICIHGFKAQDETLWARKMFAFSIIGITILSFAMIVKI